MDFGGKEVAAGACGVSFENGTEIHDDIAVVGFADMNAGGDGIISQPKMLEQSSGTTKARVDDAGDVVVFENGLGNERDARQRRRRIQGHMNLRLHRLVLGKIRWRDPDVERRVKSFGQDRV